MIDDKFVEDVDSRCGKVLSKLIPSISENIQSPEELAYLLNRIKIELAAFNAVACVEDGVSKFDRFKDFIIRQDEIEKEFVDNIDDKEGWYYLSFVEAMASYEVTLETDNKTQ